MGLGTEMETGRGTYHTGAKDPQCLPAILMTCIPPLQLPYQIRRIFPTLFHIGHILSWVRIVPVAKSDGDSSVGGVESLKED